MAYPLKTFVLINNVDKAFARNQPPVRSEVVMRGVVVLVAQRGAHRGEGQLPEVGEDGLVKSISMQ